MKREDIEKAADEFADREYEISDIDRTPLYKGFYHGADWRISSVWHDVKERPERKRKYLAQCKNDRFNVIPDSMDWDNFYKKAEIIRWAYIEDLLQNNKEDKQ